MTSIHKRINSQEEVERMNLRSSVSTRKTNRDSEGFFFSSVNPIRLLVVSFVEESSVQEIVDSISLDQYIHHEFQ